MSHETSHGPAEHGPGPGPIFVVGSGRSGTHLAGHVLGCYPDIQTTIEEEPIFGWVTAMALDATQRRELFPMLVERYELEVRQAAPRRYADKSHPNLWLAEDLARALPGSRFFGMRRNVYATVASMLKHPGVQQWHRRWREFPVPNPFLGITEQNQAGYSALPLPAQCALRWRAHSQRMDRLEDVLGRSLLVLSYEQLVEAPDAQIRKLSAFLDLDPPQQLPAMKTESIDRWRTELSREDISAIDAVLDPDPA